MCLYWSCYVCWLPFQPILSSTMSSNNTTETALAYGCAWRMRLLTARPYAKLWPTTPYKPNRLSLPVDSQERLLGGYSHQRGLCSRTAYRLYLHDLGWGMGLLWYHNCDPTLCYTLPKNMVSGWKPEMQILSYLRILCSSYLFHSLLYQYQYGHRNHAYHRDSPTLFQLWRLWTVGIYHAAIYLPKAKYE